MTSLVFLHMGYVQTLTYLGCVVVAPFNRKLERFALVVFPDWPIVLLWDHASYEKVMEIWCDIQGWGVAC